MVRGLLVFVACVIIAVMPASADYTDELQSVSVDGVFFDCGNWSMVQNPEGGSLTKHRYNYRERNGWQWNRDQMWDINRYGFPHGTVLHSGPNLHYAKGGYGGAWVEWICVHSVQASPMLCYERISYTNATPTVSYQCGWLREPYRHYSDMNKYIDGVTIVESTINNASAIRFDVAGHRTTKKGKYPVTGSKTISIGIDGLKTWGAVDHRIDISLSNFTGRCTILSVDPPANITGIRIDAISPNGTAYYEKHAYYMELNESVTGYKFFDLREHEFENHANMTPIGVDLYSLPQDDYDITVTLYTPFERINASTTLVESDFSTQHPSKTAIKPAILLIVMIFGFVVAIRGI